MLELPDSSGRARRFTACVLACATLLLAAACSTSPRSLERAARDEPGVTSVVAREEDGDDDIPFARIPKQVSVRMAADSSRDQIMAVFEEYRGDIDDGDVGDVELVLAGPRQATLSTGEDIQATPAMVRDLLDAQHDENTTEYRREAYPVGPSVERRLAAATLGELVAIADRYRRDKTLRSVTISAGDFGLTRDADNGDLALAAARQRFVLELPPRLRVTGAWVDGRGPLIPAAQHDRQKALRAYLRENAPPVVRRVVVRYRAVT